MECDGDAMTKYPKISFYSYNINIIRFFAHLHIFSSNNFHFTFCSWCVDSVLCLYTRGCRQPFFFEELNEGSKRSFWHLPENFYLRRMTYTMVHSRSYHLRCRLLGPCVGPFNIPMVHGGVSGRRPMPSSEWTRFVAIRPTSGYNFQPMQAGLD